MVRSEIRIDYKIWGRERSCSSPRSGGGTPNFIINSSLSGQGIELETEGGRDKERKMIGANEFVIF